MAFHRNGPQEEQQQQRHTLSRNIPARDKSHSASSGPETDRKHVLFYEAGRSSSPRESMAISTQRTVSISDIIGALSSVKTAGTGRLLARHFSIPSSIHLGFAFCGVFFSWIGPYFNEGSWLASQQVLKSLVLECWFRSRSLIFLRIFTIWISESQTQLSKWPFFL